MCLSKGVSEIISYLWVACGTRHASVRGVIFLQCPNIEISVSNIFVC